MKATLSFLDDVKGTFKPSYRCGFSHQKYTDKNHVDRLCKNMTDDDPALLVLYSSKQESLRASSTSALIGKKRKEATATETRAKQKQFLEAKHLKRNLGFDNEVFDLVDTRKVQVRNWVTRQGRKLLKTKACWVLRGFQDKQKYDQQTDSCCIQEWFPPCDSSSRKQGLEHLSYGFEDSISPRKAYDQNRDINCYILPDMGYPSHIGARVKKPTG